MPDLVSILSRQWKAMLAFTGFSVIIALVICLLQPKQYAAVATALPANSVLSDKARIFNQNIEGLYAELGSPDELDKIEGTAKLDTIYLAVAKTFDLAKHYNIDLTESNAVEKTVKRLQKNTRISRTGYGAFQIKVWDKSNVMAATLANALLQTLNTIHQHLQMENNRLVLDRLKEAYAMDKQQTSGSDSTSSYPPTTISRSVENGLVANRLQQYSQLINEYELALKTTPNVLLTVEAARSQVLPDRPATGQILLFAFLASLLFSFLLAVFIDSRNEKL